MKWYFHNKGFDLFYKAYDSLMISELIIFLFKTMNYLCFLPYPTSVTLGQWPPSDLVSGSAKSLLVPSSGNCCKD